MASFPWASLREVPVVLVPGAYVLATHDRSYFGETNEIKRRMSEQARDKSWVREAYVVSGLGKSTKLWFDSRTPEYFQYRFNELAERAGLVDVVKGANPRFPDLSDDSSLVGTRWPDAELAWRAVNAALAYARSFSVRRVRSSAAPHCRHVTREKSLV